MHIAMCVHIYSYVYAYIDAHIQLRILLWYRYIGIDRQMRTPSRAVECSWHFAMQLGGLVPAYAPTPVSASASAHVPYAGADT